MPDWITNRLEIGHDGDEVLEEIFDTLTTTDDDGHVYITFAKLIPKPEDVSDPNEWCERHWGTKWDACHRRVAKCETGDAGYGHVLLIFDTAWSPPEKVIEAIEERWPGVDIGGGWVQEGYEACGSF